MQAARDAISAMIDWTCATTQMSTVDAYMLHSVPGNLHKSENVDVPNWVVSFISQIQSCHSIHPIL